MPTLTMMRKAATAFSAGSPTHRAGGIPFDHARSAVSALQAAGLEILAGTDANTAAKSPAKVAHGESLHDELGLLVDAGLSPVQVLRAATVLSAEYFGLDDRGVIAPGHRADLMLVDGDPTTDIAATRSIRAVWIGGERVR